MYRIEGFYKLFPNAKFEYPYINPQLRDIQDAFEYIYAKIIFKRTDKLFRFVPACAVSSLHKEGYNITYGRHCPFSNPYQYADNTMSVYCGCKILKYLVNTQNNATIYTDKTILFSTFCRVFSAIPQLFPEIFKDEPLSEDEIYDFKLLSDITANQYEFFQRIEAWIKTQKFEDRRTKELLTKFFVEGKERKIREVRNEILSTKREIDECQQSIQICFDSLQDLNIKLRGLEASESQNDVDDILNYIKTFKEVKIHELAGTQMIIHITSDLLVDTDLLQNMMKKESGSLYEYCGSLCSKEEANRIYTDIWLNKKYSVKAICAFSISESNYVVPVKNKFNQSQLSHEVRHPHIDYYGCIGNYSDSFKEIADNGDIYAAIACAVSSAKNLNLSDSVVLSNFMYALWKDDVCCIYDNEKGTYCCIKDLLGESKTNDSFDKTVNLISEVYGNNNVNEDIEEGIPF